ncbi:MAG TPA: AAA family ATPase, partial [Rhodospirillaceae bacterium]|nr:AAA family ATPase [Rhodospirillaceae bacterium]
QFLMVDEINRASPRTQSALLQAMEEQHVTVTGREHALPTPFHVLATQNPLELEGTYPLPEAQLDRFLLQIEIDYPDLAAEKKIVESTLSEEESIPKSVMYANDLRDLQKTVRRMPLNQNAIDSVLSLVRSGRPESSEIEEVCHYVHWGPGPRASRALALALRARALLQGHSEPTLEDLNALVQPVLRHRMALNYAARADGIGVDEILKILTKNIKPF